MYICVTLATPTWPQEVLSGSVRGQVLCLGLGRLRYLSLSLKRLNLSAPCILHNSSYFVPWQNCTKTRVEIVEHFKISRWAQDCFSCKPTTVSRGKFPEISEILRRAVPPLDERWRRVCEIADQPHIFNCVSRDTGTELSFGFGLNVKDGSSHQQRVSLLVQFDK